MPALHRGVFSGKPSFLIRLYAVEYQHPMQSAIIGVVLPSRHSLVVSA